VPNLLNDLGGLRKVRIMLQSWMNGAKAVELVEVSSGFTFGQDYTVVRKGAGSSTEYCACHFVKDEMTDKQFDDGCCHSQSMLYNAAKYMHVSVFIGCVYGTHYYGRHSVLLEQLFESCDLSEHL